MSTNLPAKTGAVGSFNAKPALANRRANMKYRVDTTSLTATGVVPIKGATKYPAEPEIHFTREAWVKQCHLVDRCSKEVGWFALVDYDDKTNVFTITELVIPNQEVTSTETDIGKEDMADAAMELIEQGKDTSTMYAWFHSHVNMGVSPSSQDEYQVEDFLEDLADQPEVPAFIRGIQNKKGDLKIDVYFIQHGVAYQNVDYFVLYDDDPQWKTDIDAQIRTKVTERVVVYGNNTGGSFGSSKKNTTNLADVNDRLDDYYANGLRSGYGGYNGYSGYNYYDDEEDDFSSWGVPKQSDDIPETSYTSRLKPVICEDSRWWDMTCIYTAEGVEVMEDVDGALYVCDLEGDMYHYDEYVEEYGEIGSAPVTTTT